MNGAHPEETDQNVEYVKVFKSTIHAKCQKESSLFVICYLYKQQLTNITPHRPGYIFIL